MWKKLIAVTAITLAACATATPEKRLADANSAVTASAQVVSNLINRDRITYQQAKNLTVYVNTASKALDQAQEELAACRAKNPAGQTPDPCNKPAIIADIQLSQSILLEVEKYLKAADQGAK